MEELIKAWKIDRLCGMLSYVDIPIPEVRPGSFLIRVQSQSPMSYLKPYVEGKLAAYRAPEDFVPGGKVIGIVEAVAADVWHLKKGQRVVASSHLVARENVQEPGQNSHRCHVSGWGRRCAAAVMERRHSGRVVLFPAEALTPIEGLDDYDLPRLTAITRCIVPYGGLVRGRLTAGEIVIVNGATGAYGSAAVLVALAMGASRVIATGRKKETLDTLAKAGSPGHENPSLASF